MDTVRKYFRFLILRYASHLFRHRPVSEQHEFFYQLIGVFGLFKVNADRFSLLVNFKLHFIAVEVDGSCCKTFLTQCFGYRIQHQYFFLEVTGFGFDNLLRFFVGETAVGVDDSVYDT